MKRSIFLCVAISVFCLLGMFMPVYAQKQSDDVTDLQSASDSEVVEPAEIWNMQAIQVGDKIYYSGYYFEFGDVYALCPLRCYDIKTKKTKTIAKASIRKNSMITGLKYYKGYVYYLCQGVTYNETNILYRVNVKSGKIQKLVTSGCCEESMYEIYKGKIYYVKRNKDDNYVNYVMDLDGGNKKKILVTTGNDRFIYQDKVYLGDKCYDIKTGSLKDITETNVSKAYKKHKKVELAKLETGKGYKHTKKTVKSKIMGKKIEVYAHGDYGYFLKNDIIYKINVKTGKETTIYKKKSTNKKYSSLQFANVGKYLLVREGDIDAGFTYILTDGNGKKIKTLWTRKNFDEFFD